MARKQREEIKPLVRLLFLDFDGVLNGSVWSHAHPFLRWYERLDDACCARLERILVDTEASIVVSSAWRKEFTVDELQQLLRSRGVPHANVIGVTPVLGAIYARALEISVALDDLRKRFRVDSYAIVDDEPIFENAALNVAFDDTDETVAEDLAYLERLERRRFERTSTREGLTDLNVERVISLLKPPQDS